MISIHEEGLKISEADRKQNESISLARFSTQFRVKESFSVQESTDR